MKIYHFVLIFAAFAIGTIMVTDMKMSEKRYSEREKAELAKKLDRAAEAAAGELRASSAGTGEILMQKAIEAFFYSLYASLGIIDMPLSRYDLKRYIPVFIIGLKEGYYVYTYVGEMDHEVTEDTEELRGPDGTGYVKSGFIEYEDGDYEHEIAFMAYMKDYPLEDDNFDGYSYSSASVTERTGYIVDTEGVYHLSGCPLALNVEYVFFSEEGCIAMGVSPCTLCIERKKDGK